MAVVTKTGSTQEPTQEQRDAFVRSVLGPFEDVATLEAGIADIAEGMRKLSRSRLRRDTIVLLLHDKTKVARRDINFVLNCLESLDHTYLKPALKAG